ncbi:unnamed protein product [Rhizoctonia solani]|uniref:Ser-Thr-rich glycosyl-phosphatidyl-inositol-anchored membrane family-domain-containing protein n=1 Tax=Rhizoctonia solani TaxID=456999 RepID=A0A8H2XLB6_9AGAM|nr:unnamed protein product [Rhizoctonia solani]CAE6460863.1 unnamed protein product [Rhizoctonia solani]
MGFKRPLRRPPKSVTPHDLLLLIPTPTMLFQATSFLALVAAAVAQSLVINTPASVVQCQPAQITWTATNTPVFVSIIPGGQPGAAALQDFGQQAGSSLTWTVNIAAGTSITFQLRDSTGAVAYSSPISVQASSDSSCLGAQPSTSATATSAVASPTSEAATSTPAATSAVASVSSVVSSAASSVSSVASSATAPATTSRAVTSSAASVISSATSRASTASSPAASPSSSNAAMPTAKVGIAGLLGLAAAVVMA